MQQPAVVSSGSDSNPRYANMDDRKRKRMISNRESARRSRIRKQQHLDELIVQANNFQAENGELTQKIDAVSQMYVRVASENNVLRAQIMELSDQLRSLNSVLQIVEEVSGHSMDIPEIYEPWQLPCVVQPAPNAF